MPLTANDILLLIACKCTHLSVSPSGISDQLQPLNIQPTNQFKHWKHYHLCLLFEYIALIPDEMKQATIKTCYMGPGQCGSVGVMSLAIKDGGLNSGLGTYPG